jgi:hypothetical protein
MNARKKVFARTAEPIHLLAEGHGACFETDEIPVKGRRVGYAYREPPDRLEDSGWRFSAGDESDAYMDDSENHGLYDVNTVANYDPEIIPLLEPGIGAAFVRDPETRKFVCVSRGEDAFPTVDGHYALTASWGIDLPPGTFKRRVEEGAIVLWRPGLTAWIQVGSNDRDEAPEVRAEKLRNGCSPQAFDILTEQSNTPPAFRLSVGGAE